MAVPVTIDRYEVIDRLGRGGMGIVYRARDPRLGRTVAVKVLATDDELFRRRFLQEARLAATLHHQNIVTVFDYGEEETGPFIVMEYIEGVTLADSLERGVTLSVDRKLELLRDLAVAIDYAHGRGIVHRDIKPANLMIDGEGQLKVLDFGVARAAESQLTQAGALIGTLNYMAPEQIEGRPADRRSDVFAVGVTAYEVLSSRKAFAGGGVLKAVLMDDPVPLHDVCPDVGADVERIVNMAIEKDPSRRYATLALMAGDLDRALQRRQSASGAARVGDGLGESAQPSDESETRALTVVRPTPAPESRVQRALARARNAFATGRYESAIAAAAEVLETEPDNPEALDLTRLAFGAFERRRTPTPAPIPPATIATPTPAPTPESGPVPRGRRARRVRTRRFRIVPAVVVLGIVIAGVRWDKGRSRPVDVAGPPSVATAPVPTPVPNAPSASPGVIAPAPPAVPPKAVTAKPATPTPAVAKTPATAAITSSTPDLLQRACDGGDAAKCFQLAQDYRVGSGVPADLGRAVVLYQRACDANHGPACASLGGLYGRGLSVARDEARAAALFQRACEAGDGGGCGNAGRAHELGLGVPKDMARAVAFYQRGCAADSVVACEGLGWAYFRGAGIEQDERLAVGLFRRVCDEGNPAGCNNLGFAMEQGRGVAKDETRAAELYRQACDKNNALACQNLGWVYLRSSVIPHDSTRALALFQRACDAGNANGCVNAGFAYVAGRGVGPDLVRAIGLYQRACDAGTAEGCSRAAAMYEQGRGVTRDAGRAAALVARARELGGTRDVGPDRTGTPPDGGGGRGPAAATPQDLGTGTASVGATTAAGPVSPPARLKEVRPEYPAAALYARVQGEVVLEVTIGTDGAVTKMRVLQSIPLLDGAAEDAVKQWRFAPTVVNGKPVAVTMPVTVRFSLNNAPPVADKP